jgi:serine-type D-Ala-D-Ala carboxypeptidase/endopeptidase (penicillin-binding protein 4)
VPASAARYCALILLSTLSLHAQAQLTLPPPVAQALAAARIPAGSAAVVVQEVSAPRAALYVNPAVPMNPASVMKLVTTYAALELLGPAYRWNTQVYASAPLRDGILEGDLVLKGDGDPKLDLESFWMLLRALRARGLRDIRGGLVLDRSRFERITGNPGDFDGDEFRPYNVLPDALLVNYRSLRFTFLPGPPAGAVRIAVEPRPPALDIVNALKLAEGGCPDGRAFRDLLQPTFEPTTKRAVFAGRYPASCGEKDLNVALLSPNDQVEGVFRQYWSELGGLWSGAVREGAAPEGAQPFYTHDSAPLGELVRGVNKFSNNVMGRQIFLTLGSDPSGAPASAARAIAAVRTWLARKGVAAPELVLENGIGLSRIERISAGSLASLLQAAWRSAVMPEFIASMPIVGLDGTMRRRLKENGIAGRAHIKTGLLSDARAMAGYVLDRAGRRQVVVMIVNHPAAAETQPAMDALLRWVYER